MVYKKCKYCNNNFELTRKDKVFCSKSCKNKLLCKKWSLENPDRVKENSKRNRELNKEKNAEYGKQWRKKNKDKLKQKKIKWQEEFKVIHGVSHTTYRRQISIDERIKHNIRVRINKAIKGINKAGSAVNELDCSLVFFKSYIKELFKPNMTWDNYGEWHIDHIKPLDSFDLSNSEQFKKACHYTNLQPLWAEDNLSKGNKNPFV